MELAKKVEKLLPVNLEQNFFLNLGANSQKLGRVVHLFHPDRHIGLIPVWQLKEISRSLSVNGRNCTFSIVPYKRKLSLT